MKFIILINVKMDDKNIHLHFCQLHCPHTCNILQHLPIISVTKSVDGRELLDKY